MAFANVGAWIGNHRRAVTIGTAVSLVLTLLVGISMMVTPWWKSVNRNTYVAYFSNTNGIYTGDEVRILGVAVGTVEQIDPQPQAAKVTFMKSGERPIIPQVARAQCSIMLRRRTRSSCVRGMMNESPTGSPVVGDL